MSAASLPTAGNFTQEAVKSCVCSAGEHDTGSHAQRTRQENKGSPCWALGLRARTSRVTDHTKVNRAYCKDSFAILVCEMNLAAEVAWFVEDRSHLEGDTHSCRYCTPRHVRAFQIERVIASWQNAYYMDRPTDRCFARLVLRVQKREIVQLERHVSWERRHVLDNHLEAVLHIRPTYELSSP